MDAPTARPLSEREQLPRLLRPLDDPYGVTWRAWNLAQRLSARRTARFLAGYARPPRFERPIFVLGVPRSGTTMLFHLLRASPRLGALRGEGHDVWRMYHHPRYHGWHSDAVGAGALGPGERRFVNAYFYAYVGRQRFVEKTPENCLRVPYLLDLFPDAVFVAVRRNPCDVVNSLINGWHHPAGKYRSYFLPADLSIPDSPHRRRWSFALIEGWRDLSTAPVSEIAFEQWRQLAVALDEARALVPPDRWTDLVFDDLIHRPETVLPEVYERIGIPHDAALDEKLADLLDSPVNALSAPSREKWRAQNPEAVGQLLPRIAQVAPRAGFHVDPLTGAARPLDR